MCPGAQGSVRPMGTGMLLIKNEIPMRSFIEGGTGSLSAKLSQPDFLPDRFESGTGNTPGIIGLSSGISFVKCQEISWIYNHELSLIQFLYNELSKIDGVILYTNFPEKGRYVPLLSFNIDGKHSEETAEFFGRNGIAVRAGLHCAPLAHSSFGTMDIGTVRVCPSVFTNKNEIKHFVNFVGKIANQVKL